MYIRERLKDVSLLNRMTFSTEQEKNELEKYHKKSSSVGPYATIRVSNGLAIRFPDEGESITVLREEKNLYPLKLYQLVHSLNLSVFGLSEVIKTPEQYIEATKKVDAKEFVDDVLPAILIDGRRLDDILNELVSELEKSDALSARIAGGLDYSNSATWRKLGLTENKSRAFKNQEVIFYKGFPLVFFKKVIETKAKTEIKKNN